MNMRTLTDDQQSRWAVDGYLHLQGVFDHEEVAHFSKAIDRVRTQPGWEPMSGMLPRGHYGWVDKCVDQDLEGFMDRRDILPYDQAFIDLIDRPEIFDLVVDIMGPNILFSMSQAIVRPSTQQFPGYTHTDGGEALRAIRVTESSRPLAMKALLLLSDVTEEDAGAFTVYPGSHFRPFPKDRNPPLDPRSPGCVQLMGKAGDCFLFPHAIWHGPAPNYSGKARKTLLYNYCQLFIRAYDFGSLPTKLLEKMTPRQRRLMGDLGHDWRPGDFFYVPEDQTEVITGRAA
ncbi:MAG: phytanoyl-CoA dioxygenase family protein [Rhodospirillales bacterium]